MEPHIPEPDNIRGARVRELWRQHERRALYTMRERGSFTCQDWLPDDPIDYAIYPGPVLADIKTVTFYFQGTYDVKGKRIEMVVSDEGYVVGFV